jgi:hypothetical protein
MASDGDLFFQRRAWGFAKAYKIACSGGPLEDEAAAVVRAVRNALKSDFRMPALGPLIEAAAKAVSDHQTGLFSDAPHEGTRMVSSKLAAVERGYADFPTSHNVKTVIEKIACEAIEDGRRVTPSAFRDEAIEAVGRNVFDRLHAKPTEMDVQKAQHLDRAATLARESAVYELCHEETKKMLNEVADSRGGRPARSPRADGPDINSLAGMDAPLISTAQ